jgi:hypothetical protein
MEIFHRHAHSREAKLQVEIARLKYVSPRLRESLAGGGRQQGSGAGESDLDLDRRKIRDGLAELKEHVEDIQRDNDSDTVGFIKKLPHSSPGSAYPSGAITGYYPLNDFDGLVGAHEQGRERRHRSAAHRARYPDHQTAEDCRCANLTVEVGRATSGRLIPVVPTLGQNAAEIRSALDLLEAQEQFDPPDLSSRLKRIPGRGGGEFQISNIGAET